MYEMFFGIFLKFHLHQVAYNPKKLKKFPSIFGHPDGRGRATPIFWQKLILGIFSKFFQHRVSNDKLKLSDFLSGMSGHAGSVAGPHPFFGKNRSCLKRQLKFNIFSKFLLHRVAYGQKIIMIFLNILWAKIKEISEHFWSP